MTHPHIVTSVSVATICRVFSSAFTTKPSEIYQYYSIKHLACQRQDGSLRQVSNISYGFWKIHRELTLGAATFGDPHRPVRCLLCEYTNPASASPTDRVSRHSPDHRGRCSALGDHAADHTTRSLPGDVEPACSPTFASSSPGIRSPTAAAARLWDSRCG